MRLVDVEFSLALNNRTGKFFALRDMIAGQASRVRRVRFWRVNCKTTPTGLFAQVLGRLMTVEVESRVKWPSLSRLMPRMRPSVPVLFTDPLQVLLYKLLPSDIVIIHDMGPIDWPEFYAPGVALIYSTIFDGIRATRPHLVFVSAASRDAYVARYGSAFQTCTVIYNPIRFEALVGEESAPPGVKPPFLLCVGAVGRRKNQAGALRGFRLSGLSEQEFQLVIVGGPEPGFDEVLTEAATTSGARVLGYVSEAELRWLYRNATGFVLTSWLEGFGIPAAEAIHRDLLPVLSNEPALKEVAGDTAIYVEAGDDASIARGMRVLVALDSDERQERLARAKDHLRAFDAAVVQNSWADFLATLNRPASL